MVGRSVSVPYLRIFPIWKYGPRHNLFGEYVDEGWYPERYGRWDVDMLEEVRETGRHPTPAELIARKAW